MPNPTMSSQRAPNYVMNREENQYTGNPYGQSLSTGLNAAMEVNTQIKKPTRPGYYSVNQRHTEYR